MTSRVLLDQQLACVRRRLFFTAWLRQIAVWWLVAVVLCSMLYLARPFFPLVMGSTLVLSAIVGIVIGCVALALFVGWWRTPSLERAALALDEKHALKERVTTAVSLTQAQSESPAGRALLADVEARLATLRVSEKFPLRISPLVCGSLLLATLIPILVSRYWNPTVLSSYASDDFSPFPEAKETIDEQMQQLNANNISKQKEAEKPSSKVVEQIEQQIDQFTRTPRETRDEVRERIKDATAIEESIRREQKEAADRLQAFQEALKQQARLQRKQRERPDQEKVAEPMDAPAEAGLEKQAEELQRLSRQLEAQHEKERLQRKIRDPETNEEEKDRLARELDQLQQEKQLSEEERQKLEKQLKQVEEDLKRLSRSTKEKEQELRELAEQGKLDADQLDRELDQLERHDSQLDKKELEDLAKQLQQCERCMKEGNKGEAAERLSKAAEKLKQANGQGKDSAGLKKKLAQLQQIKRSLCRSLEGGIGAGRRPETKDDNTDSRDAVVPGEWDQGKISITGQGPFGGYKGPRKPDQMQNEINHAVQEAPAAIERQRLPRSAGKWARGYFERVRSSDNKSKK